MKTECTGGCGRASEYCDYSVRGYGMYVGDQLVEWVCEECWGKGFRTTAHRKAEEKEKKKDQGVV